MATRRHDRSLLGLRLAGAGLLVATGAIHLDLYLTGYRSIPTIGRLFALQVISAFGLAIVIALRRGWLPSAAGAGFAASTLAGYLLSVWIGLFGFKEVRTTAGLVAGVIDVAAVIVLTTYAIAILGEGPVAARRLGRGPTSRRLGVGAVATASVLAVAILGVSAAVAEGPPSLATGGTTTLSSADLGGTTVLTGAQGRTLYWFELDSPTASRCTGTCTSYWPPVIGRATLAPGIAGALGTIARAGGVRQATFDGHPLYTYVGDSGPGQTSGNGLNLNGGTWHEMATAR